MRTKLTLVLFLSFSLSLSVLGSDIYYRGEISAYRILQKSNSALYDVDHYETSVEEWYQGPYVHRKSKYTYQFKDLTDVAIQGRISYSYYGFASGDSDSFWVKSYIIRGVPFSWDSREKEWENEALNIEDKYAREEISQSFLYSLGGMDLGGIDPDNIKFVGQEEKNGKSCYLISYKYDTGMLKSWGLMGKLEAQVWVEQETFLPVKKRIEGNIAGMKYVAVITYQKYGQYFDFELPTYVSKESEKEKKKLEAKVDEIIAGVAKIRGWQASEVKDMKIEFAKKNRMKEEMLKYLATIYSEQRLNYEGEVLKWLGLIPKDADYRDLVFDSSDVAFIAGVYIPTIKTMFVSDDLDPAQAEVTLAHEAVHAFQDKRLDLVSTMEKLRTDINAQRAFMCLIEGEAATLHLEYLLNKSDETVKDWEDISRLIDEKVVHGYSRNKVFYNVYGYGAIFIQDYLKRNSWNWSALDKLHKDYPQTMEEVMHPDEYNIKSKVRLVKGLSDSTKSLSGLKIKDWDEVYSNKLGEYHLFLMLDEKLDRQESRSASLGWSNDRIDIYENKGQGQLIVLLSQWDTAQDASEFFEAYQNWLEKKKFSPNSKDPENDIFVNSQEGQVAACVLKGSQVTVIGARDVATEEFESIVREVFPKTKAEVVKPKPSKTVSSEPERPARVSTASDVSKDVSQKPSLELSLDDLNMSKEVLPSVMAFGGLLAGLIGVAFIPLLVLYIYICLTLQIMAKKTETSNAWMAWIPVLNLFLIPRIAQKPAWWGLLLLVPLLGVVIMAIIGLKIAERRNKPGWIGILVIIPVINLFVLGYLAFSKDGSKAKKEEPAKEETKENNTENKE